VFVAATSSLFACDPGMSIRQIVAKNVASKGDDRFGAQVVVHVETVNEFIGSKWYGAKVTLGNASNSPVAVSSVELAAQEKLYANRSPEVIYPLPIPPGGAKTIRVAFLLEEDVHKTFENGADLLVHFQDGTREGVSSAHLKNGGL
jgi:hypothetical protein